MTPEQLIEKMLTDGGAIVSSGICSEVEIAVAKSCGRFAVDENGLGFILRPEQWLDACKNQGLENMVQEALSMTPTPLDQFCDDLDKLVHRMRSEYDMTYAEIVGALTMKEHTLMQEACERKDEV